MSVAYPMHGEATEDWFGAAPLRVEPAGDRLRVVQITDTHLNRSPGGTLVGLDTDFSLQHVLAQVQSERETIDLVLGTGDIADHGSAESYLRAKDYFTQFDAPILWLPGNHDDAGMMAAALGNKGMLQRAAESPHWMILMLNSQVPGEVGGELGEGELSLLQQCLRDAKSRGLHVLVCLHHQPVPMNSTWIDSQMVADREAFLDIIDNSSAVRGLLWGHVHQEMDSYRGEVRLMSTPSSCIQFAPLSEDFKLDDKPPGYRWLDLLDNGGIETGVSRVTGVQFEVDLDSGGYGHE